MDRVEDDVAFGLENRAGRSPRCASGCRRRSPQVGLGRPRAASVAAAVRRPAPAPGPGRCARPAPRAPRPRRADGQPRPGGRCGVHGRLARLRARARRRSCSSSTWSRPPGRSPTWCWRSRRRRCRPHRCRARRSATVLAERSRAQACAAARESGCRDVLARRRRCGPTGHGAADRAPAPHLSVSGHDARDVRRRGARSALRLSTRVEPAIRDVDAGHRGRASGSHSSGPMAAASRRWPAARRPAPTHGRIRPARSAAIRPACRPAMLARRAGFVFQEPERQFLAETRGGRGHARPAGRPSSVVPAS